MKIEKSKIIKALSYVIDTNTKKDIISLNLVSNIKIEEENISFDLKINNPSLQYKNNLKKACEHYITQKLGFSPKLYINFIYEKIQEDKKGKIKNIIAIASGKGGVGKSTITTNIAVELAQRGYKTALIDADIYGPSIPLMFNVLHEKPVGIKINGKLKIKPVENYGVKLLSIGFFAQINQAVPWRGPMASKALQQLYFDAFWGEIDYMLIDLPPGTGDIHLTMVQSIPLDAAIIVSTPQTVAVADARKGLEMFRMKSINIPVIGLIENMSYFIPDDNKNKKYYIFGKEGVKKLSNETGVKFLGEIPLIEKIRESCDTGIPVTLDEKNILKKYFSNIVDNIIKVES